MKILVADDDAVSRTLITEILKSAHAGYEALLADDGTKAWAALETNPDVKAAIVDLSMPGMTGLDWIDRVKADTRFTHLPIIVCTASTDRATVASVGARGISNFLAKPFSRTTVLEKVWQVCRPASSGLPVVRDLSAARQRYEIDRDTHRELLGYFVRAADMWATDARRSTDYARVRALAIRANNLKQMFAGLGAVAVAARFQEAEDALSVYKTKPVATDLHNCLKKAQQLGQALQADVDRLREVLDTLT
jgi:CheY-like chemotaxis protein